MAMMLFALLPCIHTSVQVNERYQKRDAHTFCTSNIYIYIYPEKGKISKCIAKSAEREEEEGGEGTKNAITASVFARSIMCFDLKIF